jgi:hypothetical protein
VHLAQWRSARAVRAVARCWCQDDVEGYAGAGLRSPVSGSDPPPSYGGENAWGQGKHALCLLGLDAEAYAGGAALVRRRVCGAWYGRPQPVRRSPLAHRRCPAGSSCDWNGGAKASKVRDGCRRILVRLEWRTPQSPVLRSRGEVPMTGWRHIWREVCGSVGLALALHGCATSGWVHPPQSTADLAADQAACYA